MWFVFCNARFAIIIDCNIKGSSHEISDKTPSNSGKCRAPRENQNFRLWTGVTDSLPRIFETISLEHYSDLDISLVWMTM